MKLANWFRMVMAAAPLAAAGTTCITDVMLVGGNESERDALKTTYEAQGWTRIDNDLNATCGSDSDYIHLFVKSADSGSATNGVITGFYLLNSPSNYTDTITHDGRVYRLTPYDGGTHFKQLKGDLNSNTKGDTIHLYYTKAAFTDGRAVTGITFDGNSAGAVVENGGTTACDLNDGCGKGTSYIYMHAATGTGLYSPVASVTDVVARQRWPWNGLVDITCKVAGTESEWMADGVDFVVAAVMADSSVRNVTHFWVVKDGRKSADRNVRADGDYRLLWDTGADLGTGVFSNVVVRVTVVRRAKVQLWKDGPYWATTNIGAEKPEDYGLYFWWGDKVGYKREGDAWVASDGSSSSFSFSGGNAPTYGMDNFALQSAGYIDSTGNLAPEHDAAQAHWGSGWRLPTKQELEDLVNNCEWEWTTVNGVEGYVVKGKDAYESASIFLPAAGYGYGTSLSYAGSIGLYWSSVPYADIYNAWNLYFNSSIHFTSSGYYRLNGQPVRPLQGFTQ